MRLSKLLLFAVLIPVACAPSDDAANTAASVDTVPTAPVPAPGVSLASMKGTWNVDALAADKDTVLNSYQLWVGEDTTAFKMKFANQPDTLAVRVVGRGGDSIMTHVGPYSSSLRKGVMVTAESAYRVHGDSIHGTTVARYTVTTADSVLNLRLRGVRAQQ